MHPLRAALAGLIDYAGLFPPASLDLPRVVANHQRYLGLPECWLLGRLIVPLSSLPDLEGLLPPAGGDPAGAWTISVLAGPGNAPAAIADRVSRFNDRHQPHLAVVAVELAAGTPDEIDRIAANVPDRYERYVELPLDVRLPPLLDAVSNGGCYAKIRTGGVSADAFPTAGAVAGFVGGCVSRGVPFKATAGLHHPVRGSYRLTYEAQSPASLMHGFVNLLVASGLVAESRIDEATAAAVLDTRDPAVFRMEDEGIRWREHLLDVEACLTTRAHVFRSVGSCSFDDAVADLRTLGWITRTR